MSDKIAQINESLRNGTVDPKTILEILVDGSDEEKSQLSMLIVSNRLVKLLEPIKEAFEMELEPEIRSLYYWVMCHIAPATETENLAQWLLEEDNEEVKQSMLDSFLTFTERHDIPLETIKVVRDEEKQPITQINHSIEIREDAGKVLDLLHKFKPKVPVTLQRIAYLLGTSPIQVERIFEDLESQGKLPGEYLRLEQVFIKDTKRSQRVQCASCGSWTNSYPCTECGGGKVCATCRLAIDAQDETLNCPSCEAPSHKRHLLEWIKIKGTCPSCRTQLTQNML